MSELKDIANDLRGKANDVRRFAADLESALRSIGALGVPLRESDARYIDRLQQLARQADERAAVLDQPVNGHFNIRTDSVTVS